MRRSDGGIVGEAAIDFIRQFKVDHAVIGVSAIDEEGALLDFDYREVRAAQAIIENARKVILVADAMKFTRSAPVRIGHISRDRHLRDRPRLAAADRRCLPQKRCQGRGRGRSGRPATSCRSTDSHFHLHFVYFHIASRLPRRRACVLLRNSTKIETVLLRLRREDKTSSATYDLAVIGGGVNGCGIARDAAGRGLGVILLEQGDLAGATSSASTKLIHGGLRYLEYFEFRLVREALVEREVLLEAAPHIISAAALRAAASPRPAALAGAPARPLPL